MTDAAAPAVHATPSEEGLLVVLADDQQTDQPVDIARLVALAEHSLRTEGVIAGEAGLTFVTEDAMAELHEAHMGESGPTDVLSFPLDAIDPGPGPILLGDIVVCPVVAAANAPSHTGDLAAELDLLVVHGVLHLLGHDHAEPDEEAAMQAREQAALASFDPPRVKDGQ